MNRSLFIIALIVIFFTKCKNDIPYKYAIKDFRLEIQPRLHELVGHGIVGGLMELPEKITDTEIKKLTNSEHPILRSFALRSMLDRDSLNNYKIVLDHLDDTAFILVWAGEFGIWERTVSDDLLYEAEWVSREEFSNTIEKVLTKHNYLRAAYTILQRLKPQDNYYKVIKDMATRPRNIDPYYGELGFRDIEYALYGLSGFKKKEDVPIIKTKLYKFAHQMSTLSFDLMKSSTDTAYFDVLQKYHRYQFYQFSGSRPGGFSGERSDLAAPEDFIDALVTQKSERSALLLDTMLQVLSKPDNDIEDKENILRYLIFAIWDKPCPAYAHIRNKISSKVKEMNKGVEAIILESDPENSKDHLAVFEGGIEKKVYKWW